MRKLIVLPLLVLLAACADQGPIAPEAAGPAFKKCAEGPPCGKGGGGGGGGGGEALPSDVAAIAFVRNGDLVVMNADGSNPTVVYSGPGRVATPSLKKARLLPKVPGRIRKIKKTADLTVSVQYNASAQSSRDVLTNAPNLWNIIDGGPL